MNGKIFFRGYFGTSILLALIVLGFRPEPLVEAARNRSGDLSKVTKQHLVETYGKLPLSFEANEGQTSSQVKFLSRGEGYSLFLTRHAEAVLVLSKGALKRAPADPADNLSAFAKPQPEADRPAVVRIKLVGAKRTPQVEGQDEFPGKVNYFVGNDPQKWRTNVPIYAKVKVRRPYPGVDLVYYGNQRQLEQDFIVAPGADPGSITMAVDGAERLSLDAQGDLVLAMKDGEMRFQKPVVYQEVDGGRQEIPSSYVFRGAYRVGVQVAAHDESRPLIIDPVLAYSTYLGGTGNDSGNGIAVDSAGEAYVTGVTNSPDFPTMNPITTACLGNCRLALNNTDVFVTKLNPDGHALVYSTYLGGSGNDSGNAIVVDSGSNAYVTGATTSSDFPTMNPVQSTLGGPGDAFVAKLNPNGNALVYSTYLGGENDDVGLGIAVDEAGEAYVTGFTDPDFPTTAHAFQPTAPAGGTAAFVAKLNTAGNALVYSTYLGGSTSDVGFGIAVDSGGSAYVTGVTSSSDFPKMNAIQPTLGAPGADNAFVTKLNADGSALVYSTYLGGSDSDSGNAITVDSHGNAYVTGFAGSDNFPATGLLGGGGAGDVFVTKLNPDGSALVYSTRVGGSNSDAGRSISVDSRGNASVTGITYSSDFPTTANAIQSSPGGGGDAFVTLLNPQGAALVYSSYLGGENFDEGAGIALDASSSAYVTGVTRSIIFPTTANAFQSSYPLGKAPGNTVAFVTKIANVACSENQEDIEGDGHEKGDDGHEGGFRFCRSSGEMDFEERDSEGKTVGKPMRGNMNAVVVSGSQAIITGSGTLVDGTPVNYNAVVLGNAPVIGENHFAISWIAANGSVFQTSGALTDGYIAVNPQ
jgi:beta-propeller repeat-containing protein